MPNPHADLGSAPSQNFRFPKGYSLGLSRINRSCHALLLSILVGCCVYAQEPQTKQQVKIADEPTVISSRTFVAEPLTKQATVQFSEVALREIAVWLEETTSIPVFLDLPTMGQTAIEDTISDELNNEPIYLLLDRLKCVRIQWELSDGVLHIYRQGDVTAQRTQQFLIGDLLDQGYRGPDLIESIQAMLIDAQSGETEGEATLLGDVLFVRDSDASIRLVHGLLAAMRSLSKRVLIGDADRNAEIRAALSKKFTLEWREKPLAVALEELSRLTGQPLRMDRASLKRNGVSERTPISMQVREQNLRLILDRILKPLQLTWVIADGRLTVMNAEESSKLGLDLKIAVFDVRDLVVNPSEAASLQDAIEQQVKGGWANSDGVDSILFPLPGTMVMRANESTLDQTLSLLTNYRVALKSSKVRVSPETDPNAMITKYYRMPHEVAVDLLEQLPSLTSTDSWKSDANPNAKGTIRVVRSWDEAKAKGRDDDKAASTPYSVMVIYQSRRIHEEISKILHKIQSGDTPPGGMGSAGMGGFGGGMF